jgi:hypothetical protein
VTVQYFLNMEIERYTLVTGETAIAGFVRRLRHSGWPRILRHLGVPAEVPATRPPRAPPPVYDADDQSVPGLPEFDS